MWDLLSQFSWWDSYCVHCLCYICEQIPLTEVCLVLNSKNCFSLGEKKPKVENTFNETQLLYRRDLKFAKNHCSCRLL